HLVGCHEDEFRILVDEVLEQPRARDPIDFDAFARNPFHCFLHSPLAAARSSAARSRQIHGVTFSIRNFSTASSAANATASFSENGDQAKRCRNSRSGAFSLRRVNTISKNPPEFTAHSKLFAVTIAVHFRCKFGGSIGESKASLIVKLGRQRFCAIAGVTPISVSVTANVNLERRIASIVTPQLCGSRLKICIQGLTAATTIRGCDASQKPARNAIAR